MKNKITVIGAGNVGSTIAFMISVQHTADEVVIVDINQEKALGEAMGHPSGHAADRAARLRLRRHL